MFIINTFSTCFGHHYAHLQDTKTCFTARGVLRWFCWMWLVAVVGRCVLGCEPVKVTDCNLHSLYDVISKCAKGVILKKTRKIIIKEMRQVKHKKKYF